MKRLKSWLSMIFHRIHNYRLACASSSLTHWFTRADFAAVSRHRSRKSDLFTA